MINLKFDENHNPIIEGEFDFEISDSLYDPNSFVPKRKISFMWGMDMKQDLVAFQKDQYNEVYEAMGEKLKQAFIKLIKPKS